MKKLEHYTLPENTNSLYEKEAISSIGLTRDVADKINEIVDLVDELSKTDLEWKQEQEGTIRKAIIYIKDNLANTLYDLTVLLENKGFFESNVNKYTSDLEKRLNQAIAALTVDNELIDVRVGADGKEYETAGEAIREQLRSLFTFDVNYVQNVYIDGTDGSEKPYTRTGASKYFTSEYVDVTGCDEIVLKNVLGEHLSSTDTSGYAFYDEGYNPIECGTNYEAYMDNNKTLDVPFVLSVPAGARYIRYTALVVSTNEVYCIPTPVVANVKRLLEEIRNGFAYMPDTIDNYYLNNQGVAVVYGGSSTDTTYRLSDYVNIKDCNSVVIVQPNDTYLSSTDVSSYAFYDEDKQLISAESYASYYQKTHNSLKNNDVYLSVPAGACYIRYTIHNDEGGRILVAPVDQFNVNLKHDVNKPLNNFEYTAKFAGVFNTVGCIGDSLASGCSAYKNGGSTLLRDDYSHSWGQYMAKICGNTCYNFSAGGLTTGTWLSSEYATMCFDGSKLCEAYIIGLGQNDANQNVSISTFQTNYTSIINKILTAQPKAKIFVVTDPKESMETKGYNDVIRALSKQYSNVFLMDMYLYGKPLFEKLHINEMERSGHYNALAYHQIAYIMVNYIDWIIENNLNDFMQIEFIGTNYSY